jgi:hypothetical protein
MKSMARLSEDSVQWQVVSADDGKEGSCILVMQLLAHSWLCTVYYRGID